MVMTRTAKNIILMLENSEIPWGNYFLTFFCATILRTYLEAFSQPVNNFFYQTDILLANFIHFNLFYIMAVLLFMVIFSYSCNEPISKVARVLLPGFILLLVAPSVDLLTTMGRGVSMYYIEPIKNYDLLRVYLSFFGHGYHGATLGMKIEIIIILCAGFIYCRIKNRSIFNSLVCIWMCYTILFLLAAAPYFVRFVLQLMHFDFQHSSFLMIYFYLLGTPLIAIPVLYAANKNTFKVVLKDCRFLRVLHYALMLILGGTIALIGHQASISDQLLQHQDIVIHIILSLMSIFFGCFFLIAMNHIVDTHIDTISNPERPLIANTISLNSYKVLAYLSLCLSLFYAAVVSVHVFFVATVVIASYYIYSMPPIRFKRVLIFSKLVFSLNSIILILLGYILAHGSINHFPNGLFWIFFVGYTMAANFIDIKDVEGDKLKGIMTLLTIIPEKYAKLLIGFSFWVTYVSFVYLYQSLVFLFFLVVAGGIQFYFINQKIYRESQVLVVYNASIMALIAFLIVAH